MGGFLAGLTRRGWIFTALGLGISLAAVVVGQRDLLRTGILLLVLPLGGVVIAARSRVRLGASRTIDPPRVPVGTQSAVRLRLSNRTRVPSGLVLVEDTLPYTLGSRPRFVLNHVRPRHGRSVAYHLQPTMRGRFSVGPLTIRVTDPFGLVELRRAFSEVETLIVTPRVWPLPPVRLGGEWSSSGETRPRAIATAGEEDATVRSYRHGDDMRRVHWRATAHHGELMVRREEQPWQSRASVLLDTRATGHAGEGPDSSFEWAVSAAASIGTHLSERGYAVRLLNEGSEPSTAPGGTAGVRMLDTLATITAEHGSTVAHWPDLVTGSDAATGMLVAVLGRLDPEEAAIVARLRQGSVTAAAILVDASSWTSLAGSEAERVRHAHVAQTLRRAGWTIISASHGDHLATLWKQLGPDRSASDRSAAARSGAA